MGAAGTIFWKEFRGFINTPLAYIFVSLFLVFLGVNYFTGTLSAGGFTGITMKEASLEAFFLKLPWAFVILVPALAMKLWPDELKLGTIELLMSYPVRPWQVVVGKFLSGWLLITIIQLATLVTPLTVQRYAVAEGGLDWGPVWGSYAAALLLGAAFLSVGLFAGALCREQVTAFIVSLFICGGLVAVGQREVLLQVGDTLGEIFRQISFQTRFESMARGVIDIRDVVYFASFTGLFLVLNVVVLECRKAK
jgi:ABC-2 type transport system permease protein